MYRFLAIFLTAALLAIACGPEPGTPEYVIENIRLGKLVGGDNLNLLGEAHLHQMLAIIHDPKSPRMARLQMAERVTRIELKDPYPKLRGLLAHPDPEVRIIALRWIGTRKEPSVPETLIDALKKEKEVVVEANIIGALVRIGIQTDPPPAPIIDRLIAEMEGAQQARKKLWAKVLGGWRGDKIMGALSEQLASEDKDLAIAAATSIAGPLQRPPGKLVPIATQMLNHKISRVRAAGAGGLLASTYPGRISGLKMCAEEPTLALLATSRELVATMKQFLTRNDIETDERDIAKKLLQCLERFSKSDTQVTGAAAKER